MGFSVGPSRRDPVVAGLAGRCRSGYPGRSTVQESEPVSITAALLCEPGGGHRLLYTYRNTPKIKERELQAHRGSADLLFAADRKSADGEYFNGQGRFTFGTLTLTRKNR